jgi:uncharacterized protein
MPNNTASPILPNERIELIDVLRGIAVCGILIGNMQWFSGYGMMPPALEAGASAADQVTKFLVHFFVEGKFYSIFSFLFGFGFALQITRAQERGDDKAAVFKRRLFWLLIIGILHATLLWYGDILSVYALMGFLLLLFRKRSDSALLKWAAVFMVVPVVTYALLYGLFAAFVPADALADMDGGQMMRWQESVSTVTQGGYASILREYNLPTLGFRWVGLFIQMRLPKILAMFLLGFYVYRLGVFQNLAAHRPLIRKILIYGSILGIVGNIAMAGLAGNEAPFPPSPGSLLGVFGYAFGVPALALAIIALIATIWENASAKRILSFVAPVGRMALTNYLLQTVTCVVLFYGYGFGLYGRTGPAISTLIALGIFGVQVVLSNLWLSNFAYGPVEWIWRQLTYRKRISLRPVASEPTAV